MEKLLSVAINKFLPPRDWDEIKKVCKDKSGVYAFINNITGKYYIGSGINLYNRMRDYHQPWYLATRVNLAIVRAINKYGMDNFTLVVLEYTTQDQTVSSEQVWINSYKPEYNMAVQASNTLGYVHTEENKEKIRVSMIGKPRTQEVRNAISKRQIGSGNTFFGKSHTEQAKTVLGAIALARDYLPKPGYSVTVIDTLVDNEPVSYKSMRKAAAALKCSYRTLTAYNGKLFRNRYLIILGGKLT